MPDTKPPNITTEQLLDILGAANRRWNDVERERFARDIARRHDTESVFNAILSTNPPQVSLT